MALVGVFRSSSVFEKFSVTALSKFSPKSFSDQNPAFPNVAIVRLWPNFGWISDLGQVFKMLLKLTKLEYFMLDQFQTVCLMLPFLH